MKRIINHLCATGPIWYLRSVPRGRFGPIERKQVSELDKHLVLFSIVNLMDPNIYLYYLAIIMNNVPINQNVKTLLNDIIIHVTTSQSAT